MRTLTLATLTLTLALLAPLRASAHCQIPCGIYDDHSRIHMMREDVATIAKSVKELGALAGKTDPQSLNQLVRFITNKDVYAEKVMRTIADYFLAQKLPPPAAGDKKAQAAYLEKLARHHAVLVAAMKCKQSAGMDAVKALDRTLDGIEGYWPPPATKPGK